MMIYIYITSFIFYLALSYVLRRFVFKMPNDFKDNLISALLGLLIFVAYMEFFANG